MKTCRLCQKEFPLSEFYMLRNKNGKLYPHPYCKPCGNIKRRDYLKKKSTLTKEQLRDRNLMLKFGITYEQFANMESEQRGLCAICQEKETRLDAKGNIRQLCVDHCHKTGKVRQLLCATCNNGLGYFKDDSSLILKAIQYLARHQESTT